MRTNEPRIYGPEQHGNRWRLRVVTGRGRGRKTTYRSYPTRDLAEAALDGARQQAQGTTVRQAVNALLDEMRSKGLAASTIETNEHRLWHFFGLPKNTDRPLRWLQTRGAELYAAAQVGHSADTHHAELALAKRLGKLALAKRWLRADPFARIEPVGRKRHGSTKDRLSVDESRKLLAHCQALDRDQAAIVTIAYLILGARASELVKRSVRDLDDDGKILRIDRTKTRAGTRRLKLPDELRRLLLALCRGRAADAPIFIGDDGARVTRHWARYHVRRLTKDAIGRELSPQALRRTQSDVAIEASESALAVARHLGHASTAVTERSYRDRDVTASAAAARTFAVLAGGRA